MTTNNTVLLRTLKWIAALTGLILLIPALAFLFYYVNNFYPHINELTAIINKEEAVLSSVPEIKKLAFSAEGSKAIRTNAMSLAYHELVFAKAAHKKNLAQHMESALWYVST